jgi:hypothetical protein
MIMKIILFNSAIHEICSMFIIDILFEIMIYYDKMKTILQIILRSVVCIQPHWREY